MDNTGGRAVFTDSKQREWQIDLTVGLVEDVKDKCGVDLDAMLSEPEHFAELLMREPRKLGGLFWCLCEEQALARNVEPRDFGRALNRTAIDSAVDALIKAVIFFYPRASAGRVVAEALPEMLAKMDSGIADSVRKALSDSHTNSAES